MKVSVKSKKERLKRLSLFGGKNSSSDAMRAVVGVNNDDGPRGSMKRLKLSKKSLNGCKVAGKIAVPRKLRTAMKKRGCKSPSPTSTDMEKPCNSTLEDRQPKQNSDTKSKKDATLNWSPRTSPCVSMTKDEEEVAEVLFAMASMFPAKEIRHYSAQASEFVLLDTTPALEGCKMESNLGPHSRTQQVVSSSVSEGNHGEETKRVMTSDESVIDRTYVQAKHACEESKQCKEPLPRLGREMSKDKMLVSCSVGFDSEPCIGFGSQQPKETMPAIDRGTPEFTIGLASCHGSHLQCPGIFRSLTSEDSLAWPFGVPVISNERSNPQQMSTPKRSLSSRGLNHSKASQNAVNSIPWKRCATHVWIGYLIQELKGGGDKGSASTTQTHRKQEMNTDRELHRKASLLSRLRNFSSNSLSLANHMEAKHKQTRDEVKKGIPFLETQKETSFRDLYPGVYKQEKQVFDFLSLSNGEGGVDANTSKGGTRTIKGTGMWSCLSLGPSNIASGAYHTVPTTKNNYSPAYGNQASATGLPQVGQQLPTTVGSSDQSLCQKGSRVWAEQQQQMLWAAMAYPQGRQAATLDPVTRLQFSPPTVPSPPHTHFPKHAAMVPQHHHHQQQRDHRLPPGVKFYSGALPLQLL
ncbi:hypothetical protein MLD38_024814 [Melastoma candidum]|uniref:Uncharacterized protein n=1 Tax=Melastoma candidum TaxID=119954 RepID=A0ACB9NTE5_9MYRT|nr:hypothetical protein MLD38_024814 [Melastoma candidum]